ncbi:MAG: hypothetical protein SOU07_06730 [Bacilli bacterium]|nr:hypothetical protein [Bacilli bacterium]
MSFKQNMLRGLGKCHVEMLESSNREVFKEDILYGALNSISYDTYFEGTKCWYIYDLILGMQDNDYFENKIIEKLEKSKKLSIKTFNHLTDLLDQFAYDGSSKAKNVLEEQYQLLLNKKRFSSDDYEKLCNLIKIFNDLYGNKKIDEVLDDVYRYKLTHKSFDVTNLWFIQSMVFNLDEVFISKIKTYFPEFDFEYNKNNIPIRLENVSMDDIRNSNIEDLSLCVRCLDKSYHNELIDYLLEINDKEKSIIIVKNLNISNKLFNEKIDQLLNLVEKYDLQYEAYFLDFLARHKSKKLRCLAYKLIDNLTFKEYGIDLLIANHSKEDIEYLYRYFKSVSFNFNGHKSHEYVSHIIKYFNNGGKDEKIKSLLIYYYENNYCSYCRKEIIDIMKKFNLLTDEIINEMKYDCNYDIRKMAKKMLAK